MVLLQPKTASSKVKLTRTKESSPLVARRLLLPREKPPPKPPKALPNKSRKISSESNEENPPPKPPKPPAPEAPAPPFSKAAEPN